MKCSRCHVMSGAIHGLTPLWGQLYLCRKEAAFGMSHVPPEVIQNPSCHLSKGPVPSQGIRIQVSAGQLGIVVQHLLKMGDVPMLIDTVSMESATNLVIHAAGCHLMQSECCHLQSLICM